jgi:hypothetical protein
MGDALISDPQLPICNYDIVLGENEDRHTGNTRTQYDSLIGEILESLS